MLSGYVVFLSLASYVMFTGFVLYFCVFADPKHSATAKLLTVTIPQFAWTVLNQLLGQKVIGHVEYAADRILMLFYCCVTFGPWTIIFTRVYPWIDAQDYLPHYHKYIGVVVFVACVVTWRLAMATSPGILTADNLDRYDHFPYDNLMFESGQMCKTRNIPRLARSKFDRILYHENVPRFDHFCGWVHNTIGEENYRFFLLFLAVHVAMCMYGTYAVSVLFHGYIIDENLLNVTFFDRVSGAEIPSSYWIVFQYLFRRYMLEMGTLAMTSVMSIALGLFLSYHAWLTSRGLTTNEAFKWDQVKRWYSRELARYKDAVRKGKVVVDAPNVTKEQIDDINAIVHPGPKPINMYNRGLVENWKEVVFPISLRNRTKSKNT